jgi:hypothetical protein
MSWRRGHNLVIGHADNQQISQIALILEKASTRTRCAFEVAACDQGANVSYDRRLPDGHGCVHSIKTLLVATLGNQ